MSPAFLSRPRSPPVRDIIIMPTCSIPATPSPIPISSPSPSRAPSICPSGYRWGVWAWSTGTRTWSHRELVADSAYVPVGSGRALLVFREYAFDGKDRLDRQHEAGRDPLAQDPDQLQYPDQGFHSGYQPFGHWDLAHRREDRIYEPGDRAGAAPWRPARIRRPR